MLKRGVLIRPLFSDPPKLIAALKIEKISVGSAPGFPNFFSKGGINMRGGVINDIRYHFFSEILKNVSKKSWVRSRRGGYLQKNHKLERFKSPLADFLLRKYSVFFTILTIGKNFWKWLCNLEEKRGTYKNSVMKILFQTIMIENLSRTPQSTG